MSTLYYLNQYVTTTMAKVGGLNLTDTTGICLASIAGISTDKPGIALFSYSNPLDITVCEWITYTSINSSTYELNGVTRGGEGFPAHSHNNGCSIAFPISASHINNLNDACKTSSIQTVTSAATHTINADLYGTLIITAQAEAVTFSAPTGTLTQKQPLVIRIKDNGTARAITWNGVFRASTDLALPSTTVLGKTLYMGFWYNSTDGKWDLLSILNNF